MRGDGPYLDLSTEQIRFRLRKTSNPNPSVNFYRRNTSLPPPPSPRRKFSFRDLSRESLVVTSSRRKKHLHRGEPTDHVSHRLILSRFELILFRPKTAVRFTRASKSPPPMTHAPNDTSNTGGQNLEIRAKSSQSPFPRGRNYVYAWFAINIPRENWDRDIYTLI